MEKFIIRRMVLQHVIHNFPLYHKLARDKKEGERGDKDRGAGIEKGNRERA